MNPNLLHKAKEYFEAYNDKLKTSRLLFWSQINFPKEGTNNLLFIYIVLVIILVILRNLIATYLILDSNSTLLDFLSIAFIFIMVIGFIIIIWQNMLYVRMIQKEKYIDIVAIEDAKKNFDKYITTKLPEYLKKARKSLLFYMDNSSFFFLIERNYSDIYGRNRDYYDGIERKGKVLRYFLPVLRVEEKLSVHLPELMNLKSKVIQLLKDKNIEEITKVMNMLYVLEYLNLSNIRETKPKYEIVAELTNLTKNVTIIENTELEDEKLKDKELKDKPSFNFFPYLHEKITSNNIYANLITWYLILQTVTLFLAFTMCYLLGIKVDSKIVAALFTVPIGGAIAIINVSKNKDANDK